MDVDMTVSMIGATVEIDQPQDNGARNLGTAFLVDDPRPDGTPRTVLVTAAHVLDKMPGQTVRIGYRFQDAAGAWRFSNQPAPIRDGARQLWVRHPSRDIAAFEIKAPPEFARAAIPLAWLADEAQWTKSEIGPGDEMLVLGFPEGLAANTAGFPILRAGRMASYPVAPLSEFPTFLLDLRVFNGNSGSPVFVTENLHRRPGAGDAKAQFVAGILTQLTTVNGQGLELAIVSHAVFVRQTIALLDQAPAVQDVAPAPATAVGSAAP